MLKRLNNRTTFAIASLVWMALIYWQSSQTGGPGIEILAVVGHLIEYSILALLFYKALAGAPGNTVGARRAAILVAAVVLATAYGVSDEWHQSWVPNRTSDVMDVLTDLVGATVMMGLVSRFRGP